MSESQKCSLKDVEIRFQLESESSQDWRNCHGRVEMRDVPTRQSRRQPSGDSSAVDPPVPIPNTEVKCCSPDDSASLGCAKVGSRQSYAPSPSFRETGLSTL